MFFANQNIIDILYKKTARQHYLFTKILPEQLNLQSIDYYLLFRILDTIEDSNIDVSIKINLFNQIKSDFINGIKEINKVLKNNKNIEENYLYIIQNIHSILDFHFSIDKEVQKVIEQTGILMAGGMLEYLIKYEEKKEEYFIKDFNDFERYCYFVAGIVGELNLKLYKINKFITQDFYDDNLQSSINLGVYLQIINIIRDFIKDKKEKKKIYFPITLKNLELKKQLIEIIKYAKEKENSIIKFINKIKEKKIKKYCDTLFRIGKIHYDFYLTKPDILEKQSKPSAIKIFFSLPLLLKINFIKYKIEKSFAKS